MRKFMSVLVLIVLAGSAVIMPVRADDPVVFFAITDRNNRVFAVNLVPGTDGKFYKPGDNVVIIRGNPNIAQGSLILNQWVFENPAPPAHLMRIIKNEYPGPAGISFTALWIAGK